METYSLTGKKLDVKAQALAALLSVVAAVALPQALHVFGIATGLGTLPGEVYLPMHLPVILAGFIAGPVVGGTTGIAAPILSTMLTGMPLPAMLPYMVIELFIYGITPGFLRKPDDGIAGIAIKTILTQIAGRAVRALAILFAFYALGNTMITPAVIWGSVLTGFPGIVIQIVLIPLILTGIKKYTK